MSKSLLKVVGNAFVWIKSKSLTNRTTQFKVGIDVIKNTPPVEAFE